MEKIRKRPGRACRFYIKLIGLMFVLACNCYPGNIVIIVSPYGGVLGTPCIADLRGDGMKAVVYSSCAVNPDNTYTYYLNAQDPEGRTLAGWPYEFPQDSFLCSGTAVSDINKDGKEELLVKAGDFSGEDPVFSLVIFQDSRIGPSVLRDVPIDLEGLSFSSLPFSFWTSGVAVGDMDKDGADDAIIYQKAVKTSGEERSLLEGLGGGEGIFIIGTPMILKEGGRDLVVFHAAEVADLSAPQKYTHAVYCIGVRWDGPNDIAWRAEVGQGKYNGYLSAWGELGCADLDNDSHMEVVATAGIDNTFQYRVIDFCGVVLKTAQYGFQDGFLCYADLHTRFTLAEAPGSGPRTVLFTGYFDNISYGYSPLSQAACASVTEKDKIDFYISADRSRLTSGMWEHCHSICRLSPDLSTGGAAPYDPVIVRMDNTNVKEYFDTGYKGDFPEADYLSHIVIGNMARDGYFTIAGAMPDGSGISLVKVFNNTGSTQEWGQAYGNAGRTDLFRLAGSLPEMSISINETSWSLAGVRLNSSAANVDGQGNPLHTVLNSGTVPVALNIRYAGYSGCEPDVMPGPDRFATQVLSRGKYEPIPAHGEITFADYLDTKETEDLRLKYISPKSLSGNIAEMIAMYEIKAYKATENNNGICRKIKPKIGRRCLPIGIPKKMILPLTKRENL